MCQTHDSWTVVGDSVRCGQLSDVDGQRRVEVSMRGWRGPVEAIVEIDDGVKVFER